jgi:hypothetical protein
VVKTLDHYLPKSKYSHFSVLPNNLIPACRDCNSAKKETFATAFEEQTFHPYFDDVQSHRWLCASAVVNAGTSIEYFVAHAPGWTAAQFARARKHFEVFELKKQFAIFAAQEISAIRLSLRRLFASGGADAVKDNLVDRADSARDIHLNSWQTAMYEALSQSQPFCGGEFEHIG